jgi:hypothetical protein
MVALMVSSNGHLAMLFPGQGSQIADMREAVERHRPDGTAWHSLQFSVQRSPDGPGRVLTNLALAMEAANA